MIAPDPGLRSAVNRALTPKPRQRAIENDEYALFARRVLRAWARRVAAGDIDAITAMAAAVGELEDAMREAIAGLRRKGYSWAEIAARLGVTRQAAQQRWGGANRDLLAPTVRPGRPASLMAVTVRRRGERATGRKPARRCWICRPVCALASPAASARTAGRHSRLRRTQGGPIPCA
jgi:transposase